MNPHWRTHVLLLLCATLCGPAQADDSAELKSDMTLEPTASDSVAPTSCRLGGSDYSLGSVVHPRLEMQGSIFCVTCKCLMQAEGPRMNCTSLPCPVECNDPENQYCCQVCEASGKKISNRTNARSMPPAPARDEVACVNRGQQYREGQKISSSETLLRPEGPNQCVQCQCQGGVVMCNIINCTQPACSQPTVGSDSCCPICPPTAPSEVVSPGASDHKVQLPVWMMEIGQKNKRGKSCVLEDKQYMDGETWHPIMGPFGPMYCVTCQCKTGRIECSRWCPDPSQLPCNKPVRIPGQCCESCPPQTSIMSASSSSSSSQQQKTDAAKPTRQLRICLPPGSGILVYHSWEQSSKGGKTVDLIQFAFSNKSAKGIELHTWQLEKGNITSFKTRPIFNQDMVHHYKLKVLGATTEKNLDRFRKRERNIDKKCKADCDLKIRRIRQILNTTKVTWKVSCLKNETKI